MDHVIRLVEIDVGAFVSARVSLSAQHLAASVLIQVRAVFVKLCGTCCILWKVLYSVVIGKSVFVYLKMLCICFLYASVLFIVIFFLLLTLHTQSHSSSLNRTQPHFCTPGCLPEE